MPRRSILVMVLAAAGLVAGVALGTPAKETATRRQPPKPSGAVASGIPGTEAATAALPGGIKHRAVKTIVSGDSTIDFFPATGTPDPKTLGTMDLRVNTGALQSQGIFLDTGASSQTKNGGLVLMGGLGIGTAPTSTLDVLGPASGGRFRVTDFSPGAGTQLLVAMRGNAAGPQIRFERSGNAAFMDIGQDSAGSFVVEGNDASRMVVTNAGNVGIGTATPAARLDVNGAATIGSSLGVGGNLNVTGISNLGSNLSMAGTTINQTGNPANLILGGLNMTLSLGDSAADAVTVPGNFSVVGTKNFVQNHPTRPDLSVYYTALEGDEAGTYTRGSARLVDGVAHVALGETFRMVTNPDIGLTAHLTPRGRWADLYVESISTTELIVRSKDPHLSAADFDFIVYGLRIGYEDFSPVQRRTIEARVPSPDAYQRLYAANPELEPYTAAERYRGMQQGSPAAQAASVTASEALRQAIGENDPDGDRP